MIVPVKITADSDKTVMASIEKVLAGPSGNDYFNAASYMHDSGKDLNKALEYVRKATQVASPAFWQVRRESLILADLGRKAEAIEAAKKSLELAKVANNMDYVRMNEKSIAEWTKK
jgi:tetratricopeptide (TPR) repeat protein